MTSGLTPSSSALRDGTRRVDGVARHAKTLGPHSRCSLSAVVRLGTRTCCTVAVCDILARPDLTLSNASSKKPLRDDGGRTVGARTQAVV